MATMRTRAQNSAMPRSVDVTRTYLRLLNPDALRPVAIADDRLKFERIPDITVARARQLYTDVGAAYHWHDRYRWSDDAYATYLARPRLSCWLLTWAGDDAGFVEIEKHADGSVEIVLFGLLARFHGRGFGKHMLTAAVREAWRQGPTHVWLHTCTLDSPRAMPNYVARGFTPYREERYTTTISG